MSKNRKQSSRDAARPENKVSFEEVGALVKERRKYADWISALEAKRDQTPEAVFAKVHLDYEARLQAVLDKLAEHRDALSEERDLLRRKLEGIQEQIENAVEKRSETELRAQVGELSAAALTEALRVADTEIERLEGRQSTIEADLDHIQEFFAAVDGTPVARISKPTRRPGGFDEMGFLNSVVGAQRSGAAAKSGATSSPAAEAPPPKPVEVPPTPVEVPAPPRPSSPSTPTPAPEPPAPPAVPVTPPRASIQKPVEEVQADGAVEKTVDPIESKPEPKPEPKPVPRQSIAMTMAQLNLEEGGATANTDLGIIKTGDELPPSILADRAPNTGGAKPLAANIASNNPLSLKGTGPSDLKTLKCRECSAMNDPSEWYCERCGAELSAI
jgi:hypothetical protein